MIRTSVRPWTWRLGLNHGFFDVGGRPTFHAYDVNHATACDPGFGLVQTIEEPNEGSHFCPDCLRVTHEQPSGRAREDDHA